MKKICAGVLEIAYSELGPEDGWPVMLSHGFPFDIHAFDEVGPILAAHGARVVTPYLRGFGATRFRSETVMRSGQQAALGSDIIALLDALGYRTAIVAGYDWGGLASCVASALWPERVTGLISLAGYDIINVAHMLNSEPPALEHAVWYQHLFQTERGRDCLSKYRRELCRMLWAQWSPTWNFDDAVFERTAPLV